MNANISSLNFLLEVSDFEVTSHKSLILLSIYYVQ